MTFSNSKLITITQSPNLVRGVIKFKIKSFLTKLTINEVKAEVVAMGIAKLGLTIDNVEDTIVELDPNKNSEPIKETIFWYKLLYSFLK